MIGKATILALFGIMAPRASDERVHAARNAMGVAFAKHHFGLKDAAWKTQEVKAGLDVEAQENGLREGGDRLRETMREMLGRMD